MPTLRIELFACVFCALLTPNVSAEETKSTSAETLKLLNQAQNVAKRNDPAESQAAYAKVLQARDLSAEQRVNIYLDLARVYAEKNKLDDAVAQFNQGLEVKSITPALKAKVAGAEARMWFSSNFKGAWASYYTSGIDKAAGLYKQIATNTEYPNADRLAAYSALAGCHLERMDLSAATQSVMDALKLPGLSAEEALAARRNVADLHFRMLDDDKALQAYRALLNETINLNIRGQIEQRTVAILCRQNKFDEALAQMQSWNKSALAIANFLLENGKFDKAASLYNELLAEKTSSVKDRFEAAEKLLVTIAEKGDARLVMQQTERFVAALSPQNEKAPDLYSRLLGAQYSRFGLTNNREFSKWLFTKVTNLPNISAGEFFRHAESLFNLHMKEQDFTMAKEVALKILARKEITPKQKLQYEIQSSVLDYKNDGAGILTKLQSVLVANAVDKNDANANADALLLAARTAMTAQFVDAARHVYAAREKMLAHDEPRALNCTFLPNGPADISGFMNSEYFNNVKNRGRLDRKYGDNLQFLLETDSALTGRKVTEKDAAFTPTETAATCDEDGIKVFFFAPTAKASDIADGLARIGGYEIYLAAGTDAPYHAYLLDLAPLSISDDFVTQYNNQNFRRARQKENTAKIENRVVNNGVATLLSVSWEAFFNHLPQNGNAWNFEAIHWEQGGYSWGGSKSVHNRSSFGSLVFTNLTPDNQRAIKRRLIAKALAAYKKETSPQNGFVEIWQDPELGDQKFYLDVIKPLQTKLDNYAEKVKSGLSAEDVDLLFSEAVPQWMNIKYTVATLRRKYLEQRRIEGN